MVLILASVSAFAIVMGLHLMGRETPEQLLREPRLLIPSMAVGYLIAGAIVWAVFTWMWQQPFTQAVQWNFSVVRRRWPALLVSGVGLSLIVQFSSNFLPIPKSLPIDDFFRTPGDVWMVALFGTFVAPVFEELAFRGFLLPLLSLGLGLAARGGKKARGLRRLWSFRARSPASRLPWSTRTSWRMPGRPLAVLFTVSLVLCAVRLMTRSLAASTFLHATYNGTIFTILFFVTGGFRHLDKIT